MTLPDSFEVELAFIEGEGWYWNVVREEGDLGGGYEPTREEAIARIGEQLARWRDGDHSVFPDAEIQWASLGADGTIMTSEGASPGLVKVLRAHAQGEPT